MITKALIYCRVSSAKQAKDGNGLSSQEKICRDYAKDSLGMEVEKVFYDEGISGGMFERKAMKNLLKYLDTNKKNSYIVIFEDLNRFSRDVQVHHLLKSEFRKRGVELCCANFEFEESPEGKFRENMNVSMAQYEKDKNRERVLKRMKTRLEQGFRCFAVPLGLKYTKSKKGGKVIVFDDNYKIIKTALEKFASNELETINDVVKFLNINGIHIGNIVNGKVYSQDAVNKLLRNILYTGYLEYKEWGVERRRANHEALISLKTFKKIETKLTRSNRYKNKNELQEQIEANMQRKDIREDFPLRGFLYCEESKFLLSAGWSTGRNKKYPYYTYPFKSSLSQSTIKRDIVHSQFEEILKQVQPKEELIQFFEKAVKNEIKNINLTKEQNRKKKETELKYIQNQIYTYVRKIGTTKSEILIKNYEREIENLECEKEQIMKKYKIDQRIVGTTLREKLELVRNALDIRNKSDLENKRRLIKVIFPNGIPVNKKKQLGTVTLSLIYQAFNVGRTDKKTMVQFIKNNLNQL